MKNYNEMANDVLRRIGEHETLQRNRRKVMKKVILPICCFCLVALLGLGLWQGDFFESTKPIKMEDSTIVGEKDYVEPDKTIKQVMLATLLEWSSITVQITCNVAQVLKLIHHTNIWVRHMILKARTKHI